MRRCEALVVGGGPAGLAVAYALQGDTLVLERDPEVGGLCRSIKKDGAVFDIGGHSFHTPHPEVYELVSEILEGGLEHQPRDARVYTHGTLLPYPFQKFYDRIPDADVVRECEEGLRSVGSGDGRSPPRDFEEFILARFGKGIAEHFMLPYNRKLWARDIKKISCEWTSERVAAPKGEAEEFDRSGGRRRPLQPEQSVGYPPKGGFEAIFRALAARVPVVETGREVVRVDPVAKQAVTSDGERYAWEFLVSTMPLPCLVRVVDGTPPEVVAMADQLEYMSLRVELILVGRSLPTSVQRIYCADPEIPPHKIALNHNSSDDLRNRDVHGIMAEVSLSPEKSARVEEIAPRTISFLHELGLLPSPDDVRWTGHVDVEYAYPVYTHERPELVRRIHNWMAGRDIYPVGRFGDWTYVNSDRCIHRGLELGKQLRSRYSFLGGPPQTQELGGGSNGSQ